MVLLTSGAGRAQQPCDPPDARVVSIQGTVELRRAGTDVWTPAMLEEALCIGDALRVGQASRAALALANDSTLRLDQRTTLQLRGVAAEERSLLELLFGAVYFFSHRPRALEVDTPFVNAAAEGTEFLVRVGEDRAEVVMLDGQVLLQNPHGELRVASGDAALIPAGEAPRPMVVARPRDAVAWALYYPPILAELAGARGRPLPYGLQAAVERVAANDYAGALEALEAVPEAARDARYHTYRAGVLLNVGRVEEAAAAIAAALALDPEAGEALAQRAIVHVVQNREAAALADARRALELRPESSAVAIALSYVLQAAFQLEDAREVLRAAVERNPEDALAWARLAELEQMFGNLRASRNAAEQAVALAPNLARTQMVLGFAALTRIDIDGARAAFERAIELDSANPLPRLGLGLAKIRRSELAGGRHEIEIAAALDPNDALIRSYLGKAYFEERRDPLDAEQFAIAKELDPNDPTPWLYDGIRLQTENRPVEALRSLERSIELNDNRAPFRSRLLLDQDLATRSVSLARIYNDLGFDQVALAEATNSLSTDPANHSAHRFLSDTYARLPRHEIARASELLQSQLLQPININPVQPSLPITDLNVISGVGPAEAAFNEFHPLFERNRAQLTATGVVGNHRTLGDEVVASGLWNRLSFSAGQFHSETDGFRDDKPPRRPGGPELPGSDADNDLYNLFVQAAATPSLSLQAEYRRRETEEGDLALRFDPDFILGFDRELTQNVGRVGARWTPVSGLDAIASVFYTDTSEEFPTFRGKTDENGYQAEARVIYGADRLDVTAGGGKYDLDVDFETFFEGPTIKLAQTHDNVYVYTNATPHGNLALTVGVSYDRFEEEGLNLDKVNPKLGVNWDIADNVRLRAAAFHVVKRALSAQQTIEPTHISGFNQFFDDFNGTKSRRYGAALDIDLTDDVFVGLEVSRRELDVPRLTGSGFQTDNADEELLRAYLYWVPHPRWSMSFAPAFEKFESQQSVDPDVPADLKTVSVPLAARYFDPRGFFAEVRGTFVNQDLDRQSDILEGDDNFVLLDATMGYRLPKRAGIISVEARNLLDKGFQFQDEDFRASEIRNPRFIPDRTILARLTLNF